MTLTAPLPGQSVNGTWTNGETVIANGFLQSANANASATLTLGNAQTDVAGMSVSVTVAGANAFAEVTVSVDIKCTTAQASAFAVTQLLLDGVAQTGTINFGMSVVNIEAACAKQWKVPLTAGTHTLKVQGNCSGTSVGTISITNSNISVLVIDLP